MKSINSLIPFRSGFAAKWFTSVQFCCQKNFWAFELFGFHSLGFKGCVFDYQPAWIYWGRFEWALGFLTEEMASISGFWAELLLSGQGQGLWLSLWGVQVPGALTCIAKAKGSQSHAGGHDFTVPLNLLHAKSSYSEFFQWYQVFYYIWEVTEKHRTYSV